VIWWNGWLLVIVSYLDGIHHGEERVLFRKKEQQQPLTSLITTTQWKRGVSHSWIWVKMTCKCTQLGLDIDY